VCRLSRFILRHNLFELLDGRCIAITAAIFATSGADERGFLLFELNDLGLFFHGCFSRLNR
jgi:hypothetical protein